MFLDINLAMMDLMKNTYKLLCVCKKHTQETPNTHTKKKHHKCVLVLMKDLFLIFI
ncbi:hypothetical protein HanRHA438_Chr02g0085771 [Helianthus annuus]|nr:hypothetical protein HanRHA438_Chr02g0085771 [Helianthus annuus]